MNQINMIFHIVYRFFQKIIIPILKIFQVSIIVDTKTAQVLKTAALNFFQNSQVTVVRALFKKCIFTEIKDPWKFSEIFFS